MAENPYVNKVEYGNQTIMDISDTTAEEDGVAEGEVFYKKTGERAIGTGDYYSPNDATESTLTNILKDNDLVPFYNTSISTKKNSTWANIKAKLNEIFFKRSEANILGAKNLLPLATTETQGTIVWTINNDGTIIANGSSGLSQSQFLITVPNELSGNYYFSGCPSGGSDSTYDIYAIDTNTQEKPKKWDGITQSDSDIGDTSQEIQIPNGHIIQIICRIKAEQTVNNLIFKPMLRLSTDVDNTFASYAMTNKELTIKKPTPIELTQLEYNALTSAEKNDPSKIYMVTDDDATNINWGDINGSISNQLDLVNALAEITPTILSKVLVAGNTSVTFTELPIQGDYIASFYTSNGANYISIDNSIQGQVTVFYSIQNSDITVYLRLEKIQ